MDFFEHQEVARKKTRFLVISFILSVIAIVILIYLGVAGARVLISENSSSYYSAPKPEFFDLGLFALVGGGTLAVILLGSGFKTMQLTGGGAAVAQDLGGRKLDPESRNPEERKLLNIVEEMAIASGMPVPEVYLLENEDGINAFAAGRTPSDAVIGVTRGCMQLLNRDELQGVIAHEFSHILNGDMRLNMRMVCLLYGILVVAILGQIVMRVGLVSGRGSRDSRGAGLAIMVAGIAIIVIGYIGVFFGSLIKAAMSRQREFLADASAVQYTRNPNGIGGALQKIGGHVYGAKVQNPKAEEASHMFFAEGLSSAFATHPPLPQRIARILPNWDGSFPSVDSAPPISVGSHRHAAVAGFAGGQASAAAPPASATAPAAPRQSVPAAANGFALGMLDGDHIAAGTDLRNALSPVWVEASHNRSGAQALIFALLLGQDDALRNEELEFLLQNTDEFTFETVQALYPEIRNIHSSQKLALIDLSIPSLKRLSPAEYDRFRAILHHLVASDNQVDLFEFTLEKVVQRHLDIHFRRAETPRVKFQSIAQLNEETSVLITTAAGLGAEGDEGAARKAFEIGVSEIVKALPGVTLTMKPPQECGLANLDQALERFDQATPLVKKQLLNAVGKTIMADGVVISDEAELLRAIADTIGAPIPPFLRG